MYGKEYLEAVEAQEWIDGIKQLEPNVRKLIHEHFEGPNRQAALANSLAMQGQLRRPMPDNSLGSPENSLGGLWTSWGG